MKRKKSIKDQEPHNLKRFKDSMKEFVTEEETMLKKIHGGHADTREFTKSNVKSRKDKRKEARKLKKMRRNAFVQRQSLPTSETVEKEKESKDAEKRAREKAEKKRKKSRSKKKKQREKKKEETDQKKQNVMKANAEDDKAIKKYEKLLHLNKKKKKTITQGFKNDGLDYILEAVDGEKLQELYQTGVDESDDDVTNPMTLTADDFEVDQDASDADDYDDMAMSDSDLEDDDLESDLELDDDGDLDNTKMEKGKQKKVKFVDEPGTEKEKRLNDLAEKVKELVKSKEKGKKSKKVRFEEEKVESESAEDDDVENDSENEVENDSDFDDQNDSEADYESDDSDIENFGDDKEFGNLEDVRGSENGNVDENKVGQNSYEEEETEEENDNDEEDDSDAFEEGSSDNENSDESDDSDNDNDNSGEEAESEYKEDIYGRLRDKEGNLVGSKPGSASSGKAYIPPGKRLQMMSQSTDGKKKIELERMKKQLKGLINRLSEQNMQPISSQIEEMFRTNSRAYLGEALTDLLLSACVSADLIPDRLVTEHAMLLAILHNNVGSEVGAMFIQTVAQRFDELYTAGGNYGGGKEMDNLLVLLSHTFNFKVVHSLLIFDILKKLSERFQEREIELILVILKCVGLSLRKSDPAALKEFILLIQDKAASVDTKQQLDQSRLKFMLEIVTHIKNNNVSKIPNYDPSHVEHLKKLLRNYSHTTASAESQLKISLEDLLSADQKGRWWLVGSAWQGRDDDQSNAGTNSSLKVNFQGMSAKLLELARKQRMNTDNRKNIFCIVMTSEDFLDAFEKLLRLGLKHQPEREIIHVILDLCVQEKTFNPYYAYLTQKFCEYDRRFQMTVQFNTWDRFKELSNYTDSKIDNLAQLLSHLISSKAMSLSIFKVIEFADLDKYKVKLMTKVLVNLIAERDEYVTREVFSRVASIPKLKTLREGLRLFIHHFILRTKKRC